MKDINLSSPMSQDDFEMVCAECESVQVGTIKSWRKRSGGYSNEKIDDMYLGYSLASVALEKQKSITRRVSAESNRLFDEKAALIDQLEASNSRFHEVAVGCATAEQERDRYRGRAEAAEAELKRRDSANPHAWQRIDCAECDQLITKHSDVAQNWLDKGWTVRPLFTFGDADPELIALRAELKRRDAQKPAMHIYKGSEKHVWIECGKDYPRGRAVYFNAAAPAAALPPERDTVRTEHAAWSHSTFGNVGPVGPLKHLANEALEAASEPGDLSEWADMQFLLWDAQRRAGITDEQITQAMIEKLSVNKTRHWPEPKDGEPRLHIKEQAAPGGGDAI